MATEVDALKSQVTEAVKPFRRTEEEIGKVIVGQKELVNRLMVALLADGHLLLEGLPGLAKTLAVNTLAKTLNTQFKRIQFTPDLLPADLIGTSIYNPKEGTFSINKGPIFTQILLADEINRAPAKVQSALLEVMQERQVTISGETFKAPTPYLVLATQNPIEQEGTYPLPEAQTDRFMMKVKIDYPSKEEEKEILARMGSLEKKPVVVPTLSAEQVLAARKIVDQIYIDPKVIDYILNIIEITRNPPPDLKPLIHIGASPRASLAFIQASKAYAFLSERSFVTPNDVKLLAPDILRHRLKLTYEAEAEDLSADDVVAKVLDKVKVP
jgi:MoxR-like ATPase